MTSETSTSSRPSRPRIYKYLIAVTIILGALAAGVFSLSSRKEYGLEVRSYFADAKGLEAGAPVRLAGVNVGTVKSVRARPELKDHPAEVILSLRTEYLLSIPADSTVSLASAGLLGPAFVDIDVRNASGPPVGQQGILKSVPSSNPPGDQLLERMVDILNAKACGENSNQHPPGNGRAHDSTEGKK